MAEAPEIPEANDPFEKRVALTIAILAIVLSFIDNRGDNAKTDAIIKTNEASNQWSYYQAKSVKGEMAAMHANLLNLLPAEGASPERRQKIEAEAARVGKETARYDTEKAEIQKNAKALQEDAAHASSINDRCDLSALFLQVGIVICSVAILAQSHKFWWAGIALGVIGAALGVTAFLM